MFVDYYELLEVDSRASSDQIKLAYRARMVRDHADQNPDDELAKDRMILLTRAKVTLLDERRRMGFDRDRARWQAASRLGVAPPRWSGGRAPDDGSASDARRHMEVDLRDISISRLIVGLGFAAVVTGLGLAARVVADRAGRRRKR